MPSENRLDGIDACLNIGALERSSGCKRREERDMAGQAEQMAAELDRRGTAVFSGNIRMPTTAMSRFTR
ncbi:esterase [Neisseria gonorrhoeae]|uniref:Esterase n=1 Tax=Neisseria gonorrhoeae TaxID=485 RepID=A0A378W2W1_NEIGO|nr:esterase [Neisseria gonorrhoeae]